MTPQELYRRHLETADGMEVVGRWRKPGAPDFQGVWLVRGPQFYVRAESPEGPGWSAGPAGGLPRPRTGLADCDLRLPTGVHRVGVWLAPARPEEWEALPTGEAIVVQQRRSGVRVAVRAPVIVEVPGVADPLHGETLDISTSGIRFATGEPLPDGGPECVLRVAGRFEGRLPVVTVHLHRRHAADGRFEYGGRFVDLPQAARDRLMSLVADLLRAPRAGGDAAHAHGPVAPSSAGSDVPADGMVEAQAAG